MTKILCCSCSKQIKVPVNRLRVCKGCGRPVCWSCQLEGICKECGIILHQNVIRSDYFEEKYKETTVEYHKISEL